MASRPLLAAVVLFSLPVAAGRSAGAAEPGPEPLPEPPPIVAAIDEAHDRACNYFGELFERVDRLFGEQYVEDRDRKIQVRAGARTTFNDRGASTDTELLAALRVPLPALERRFNGFLEVGDDISELGKASSPNFDESRSKISIAAGLLGRYRENVEVGLKLTAFWDDGSFASIYPFVRFERHADPLRFFFEQRLVWESENLWRSRTEFDLDRTLDPAMFLRLHTRGDHLFGDPGVRVAHGIILRRSLSPKNVLSPEIWLEYTTSGDSPSTTGDDMLAYGQLRWRGRVWRDWLEYELRPSYTFVLNSDRDPFFSFLVSLTVLWDSHLGGARGVPAAGAQPGEPGAGQPAP